MYEKIKTWISNNRFLIGLGVGAVLFLACYLFSRAGIHDNGNGTGDVGTKLQQAIGNQQSISAGITDSKKQLKASEKESTEAKLQKEQLQKQLIELEASSKNQETFQKEILKSLPPSVPVVLREIGAKIDVDHYVSGISYGVSRRIGSKYIGLRGEYDWGEKKAGVWLTYTY